MNKEYSLVIGARLKLLREERGLSHAKLKEELNSEFGIIISEDSLQNYEVCDKDHSRVHKNLGMKLEYLRCFADYYGVSADYILGLTDVRSPEISTRETVNRIGISEQVQQILAFSVEHHLQMDELLNTIAETVWFEEQILDRKRRQVLPSYLQLTHIKPDDESKLLETDNIVDRVKREWVANKILSESAMTSISIRDYKKFLCREICDTIYEALCRKYVDQEVW